MSTKNYFDNTEVAFKLKSDSELKRAYFLFRMISKESLVKIGTAVTKFALKLNLPVEGIIRSTVFDHFCGGVNEQDCMPTVEKLYDAGVASVLDYSVEGKEEEKVFDATAVKVKDLIEFSKDKDSTPFSVFKPTGFGKFEIFRKVTENEKLNEIEQKQWKRIKKRFDETAQKAYDCDVQLLIDSEHSWMQDAADKLCEELMMKYNKEKPIVFNTLQLYRHDRFEYLKKEYKKAKEKGYKLGFKIVRGAYLEVENERAIEKNYPTPICKSKKATDDNFDEVMTYILKNLDDISVFIGTHNEQSTYLAMDLMEKLNIDKKDDRVWFSQLYGMSDHISFNLAELGYNVAKYLPFGPVKDVMPYLIRRAEENTSVAGQTSRELSLLKRERERRKLK